MNQKITGIYLAAGESRRMGRDKLSLPFRNTTLGSMGLLAALHSRLDQILVISRKNQSVSWIDPSLTSSAAIEKWRCLAYDGAERGQAHSLAFGIKEAHKMGASAAMILLADQPFITPQMLDRLILYFQDPANQGLDYIAAAYNGLPLPPILFSANAFPLLLQLKGDEGARRLLRGEHELTGTCIAFTDPKPFFDVDTLEDYQRHPLL